MYKIEKDIPLKEPKKSDYPFQKMEVGDSFLIEAEKSEFKKHRAALFTAIYRLNTKAGDQIKITTRTVEDGLRVWRTK
jgi:hypothetical protein